jgi:hypothetical protein
MMLVRAAILDSLSRWMAEGTVRTVSNGTGRTDLRQFLNESHVKTGTAVAIVAKIRSLHQQIAQDRSATKVDKTLSQEVVWLAALTALNVVTGENTK